MMALKRRLMAASRRMTTKAETEATTTQAAAVKANDTEGEQTQKKESPFRHFQGFSGMDDYVDATLIHYDNSPVDEPAAPAANNSDATQNKPKPHD